MIRRGRTERGAAATELALLVPVVIMVVAVRVWLARAAVTDAAYATARAATLQRTAGQARASAQAVAASALTDVPCVGPSVAIDTAGFAVPVGTPAQVRTRITCTVDLSDLFGLAIPGTLTVEASAASALDTYRRRQ